MLDDRSKQYTIGFWLKKGGSFVSKKNFGIIERISYDTSGNFHIDSDVCNDFHDFYSSEWIYIGESFVKDYYFLFVITGEVKNGFVNRLINCNPYDYSLDTTFEIVLQKNDTTDPGKWCNYFGDIIFIEDQLQPFNYYPSVLEEIYDLSFTSHPSNIIAAGSLKETDDANREYHTGLTNFGLHEKLTNFTITFDFAITSSSTHYAYKEVLRIENLDYWTFSLYLKPVNHLQLTANVTGRIVAATGELSFPQKMYLDQWYSAVV